MDYQARIYTRDGIITITELDAMIKTDYPKPKEAKQAIFEVCDKYDILGGQIIKLDGQGHYKTVFNYIK